MKNSKFNTLYRQLTENITCGSAGVGSTNPTPQISSDFYAPGDARLPTVLGIGKKRKKGKQDIPIMTRNFPTGL